MTQARELLKIGAFAKHAGTNLRTLRFYEEVGLLMPTARSSGGFRYYRETDLNRIKLIRHMQDLGLTLEEIKGLLKERDTQEDRSESIHRVRETLNANKELLDSRMEQLQLQLEKIEEARKKLMECENCEISPSPQNNHCEPCDKTGMCLPELLSALY
jgi:DNA-binding transcriptional MerR regulator